MLKLVDIRKVQLTTYGNIVVAPSGYMLVPGSMYNHSTIIYYKNPPDQNKVNKTQEFAQYCTASLHTREVLFKDIM